MELTNNQQKEMDRVFPNGFEESDIPAFWRRDREIENYKE